jgi:type IV pilus assembly protein PilB
VPTLHLGTLLLHRQAVSRELLHAALREQRETGLRLGEQLQRMGVVTNDDLLRALAAQAGVGYLSSIDPARVSGAPGGLAPEAVRALSLVPFEVTADGERVRVASAAPLRRLALSALAEMTGLRVEPFIVSDEVFRGLLAAYGSARHDAPATASGVRTVSDAAARIARAAEQGEALRMQHTRCDDYVWVRLQGRERSEDLVLSVAPPAEERTWLAAPSLP